MADKLRTDPEFLLAKAIKILARDLNKLKTRAINGELNPKDAKRLTDYVKLLTKHTQDAEKLQIRRARALAKLTPDQLLDLRQKKEAEQAEKLRKREQHRLARESKAQSKVDRE